MSPETLLHDPLARLLAQIVAIVLVSRGLGLLTRRIGQPMVIAEITAGILLGPSLLGWIWPAGSAALFAPESLAVLQIVSQIGLVLFMFLVGLELDPRLLHGRAHTSVAISHSSIVLPFAMGGALAWQLYPTLSDPSVDFVAFALFMGAAMSITAFPVLARILTERRLLQTRVGAVTLACAAVDDVTAWCLLAFVVAAARSSGVDGAIATTAGTLVYIAVMLGVVRPILGRVAVRVGGVDSLSHDVVAGVVLLTFLSSWVTELIGIHALFGAFALGAVLPKGNDLAAALAHKLEDLVIVVLLPLFFAYSGVRTQIGLLDTWGDWAVCSAIIAVACAGKFGGSAVAARLTGMSWREAGAVGVLMNTRGLMELVVLNIGLDIGVIGPKLFTMMVIMALVTTFVTTPLLQRLHPAADLAADVLPPARSVADASREAFRVLVCVASGRSGPGLVSVAAAFNGPRNASAEVHALHLLAPSVRGSFVLEQEAAAAPPDPALRPLQERADALEVRVRPISFVSNEPASDICRVAQVKRADLVLMGWHRPIVSQTLLGGVVYDVMKEALPTVGVFVDRGLARVRTVLVPFRGSPHDQTALELAHRLAVHAGAEITVASADAGAARAAVASVFGPLQARVHVRILDGASPIDAVITESRAGYDLLVVGVGNVWGLEQRLIGLHPEKLINESPTSLLVVRGPLPRLAADRRPEGSESRASVQSAGA